MAVAGCVLGSSGQWSHVVMERMEVPLMREPHGPVGAGVGSCLRVGGMTAAQTIEDGRGDR